MPDPKARASCDIAHSRAVKFTGRAWATKRNVEKIGKYIRFKELSKGWYV